MSGQSFQFTKIDMPNLSIAEEIVEEFRGFNAASGNDRVEHLDVLASVITAALDQKDALLAKTREAVRQEGREEGWRVTYEAMRDIRKGNELGSGDYYKGFERCRILMLETASTALQTSDKGTIL